MNMLIKQTSFSRSTKFKAKKILSSYFNEWVNPNLSKFRMTSWAIKNVGYLMMDYSLIYSDIYAIHKILEKNPDNIAIVNKGIAREYGFKNYAELMQHLHLLESLHNISVYKTAERKAATNVVGGKSKYEKSKIKDVKKYNKRVSKFVSEKRLSGKRSHSTNEVLPKVPQ